jgi:hypothetical protein
MLFEVSIFDEMIEKGTPLPDNICKDCGGEVAKSVSSVLRGVYYYGPPVCQGCGREYRYATNVPAKGILDLRKMASQRYI